MPSEFSTADLQNNISDHTCDMPMIVQVFVSIWMYVYVCLEKKNVSPCLRSPKMSSMYPM